MELATIAQRLAAEGRGELREAVRQFLHTWEDEIQPHFRNEEAVLLPVFAGDVLGGDARTLGLLTSCAGLGALLGAFWLAARESLLGLGRVVVRSRWAGFAVGDVLPAPK